MRVAYDGRDFHGWAAQPESADLRTVQGELQRVLGHLFAQPVEVQCAGRTDAGVHARGQVAHVDVDDWPAEVDARRINRALPDDIRVSDLRLAESGFDARFAAIWRRYTYRVSDDGLGPAPLERHAVLPWNRPLDLDRMNVAAADLLGEHDFAPFCRAREFATTVRALQRLDWQRDDAGLAVMTVQADAFCHSMVRSLVGVLLPVGDGRRPVRWPGEVLVSGVRDSAVTTMPAYPLVLEEVGYPPAEEMRARQLQTRSLRTLGPGD
jgi:tRNA pseudouridine38-40 synthase